MDDNGQERRVTAGVPPNTVIITLNLLGRTMQATGRIMTMSTSSTGYPENPVCNITMTVDVDEIKGV